MRTPIVAALVTSVSLSLAGCGGMDPAVSADALQASDVCVTHPCCGLVVTLDGQTAAVPLFGKNAAKDRAALRNDLVNVSIDLEKGAGQYPDAISTLTGYWTDVMKLATCDRQKIAAADADTLLSGAEGAIACIDPAAIVPVRADFVCPIPIK